MKRNQKFAIRVLEQDPAYLNLDQRDRAFARNLLSTTERRMGQIDQVIKSFAHKKEDKKKNTKIRPHDILCEAALRIGATQILFLDVPTYAAVSETVEALKNHPKVKVSKAQISYVNAVLRNIDREGKSRLDATSTLANVDTWLADQWIQTYGKETTEKMVGAAMSQSPVIRDVFTSIAGEEEDDDDDIEQVEVEAELLPIGSIRIPANVGGSVSKWPLYDDGAWWVQDVSATLPAIALFNSLCINGGKQPKDIHVVDLCSAPGGKTAQLCSMGFGKVDAVEISKRRSRSLHQNLKRLGMEKLCNVCVEDGTKFQPYISENDDGVQGVLVDAPCSATGLGSRRPDVLRKSINLDELISIQRELVVHAANNILDVGGVLVYATCSLLKQEGEDQVDWLLSQDVTGKDENTELLSSTLETIPFEVGEIPGFDDCIDEKGWLRVIPGVLPGSLQFCDGFFVARMRKIA
ncbi:S-adenosyl-L-methionine-dependent methyltransferase [Fragilariopsis cylindrus CCMP1102]|uniref:S-adenosyl-L-methionine-dependent methyltransferase n=1 Tax=Fragilariopsis cylindrus CCMP1102 TaxID=635003 RepID=A0A1E7FHM0_9STRA|nr:S-adenosyl-L-methionine-dependent methyltransferase [Fragilariopsis cylindrus CCMP1102]|eukprot:OEU17535.1 S-adenosyl-L-methionine-dependent methyltransferase [Fragilariopsis cylindrus CCMP1102]